MKGLLIETHAFKASPQQLTENISEAGNLLVEGVLATAEVKNGNGRYYSKDLWDREMGKYSELIEQDHLLKFHIQNQYLLFLQYYSYFLQ